MHTSKLVTSVRDLATSLGNRQRSSPQLWPYGLSFPTAVKQLKFLIVGIDYFTKWVKAEALATITEKTVQSFVWKNIICRYGIPRVLVLDN